MFVLGVQIFLTLGTCCLVNMTRFDHINTFKWSHLTVSILFYSKNYVIVIILLRHSGKFWWHKCVVTPGLINFEGSKLGAPGQEGVERSMPSVYTFVLNQ